MNESLLNRQIDDFIIQEQLHYSALSVIYRAAQPSLNRMVSFKVLGLDEQPLDRAEFLRNFMEQAGAITQIEHMHILPIYAYGVVENEFAYVVNRLTPKKLSDMVHKRLPSFQRSSFILSQTASALDYARGKGLLHGSISPGNIYLDNEENAYIDDYEMSKVGQAARTHDQLLKILGTPVYASPEQLRLEPITPLSDIYSLGAILYRMVVRRAPFEMTNGTIPELIQLHEQNALVPPRQLNPDIPSDVEAVILKAMHENPNERFETAAALAQAFEAAAHSQPASIRATSSSPAIQRVPPQRTAVNLPVWTVVTVAAILFVALLLVLFLLSQR